MDEFCVVSFDLFGRLLTLFCEEPASHSAVHLWELLLSSEVRPCLDLMQDPLDLFSLIHLYLVFHSHQLLLLGQRISGSFVQLQHFLVSLLLPESPFLSTLLQHEFVEVRRGEACLASVLGAVVLSFRDSVGKFKSLTLLKFFEVKVAKWVCDLWTPDDQRRTWNRLLSDHL